MRVLLRSERRRSTRYSTFVCANRLWILEASPLQDPTERIPVIHPLVDFTLRSEPANFQGSVIFITQYHFEQSRTEKTRDRSQSSNVIPRSLIVTLAGGSPFFRSLNDTTRLDANALTYECLVRNAVLL